MANTLVQFRADENARVQAISICARLGIDLQTYLRMCMSRLVEENGIPFSMKLEDKEEDPAILAMKKSSKIAAQNGISDMSLDDINAEINAARRGDK